MTFETSLIVVIVVFVAHVVSVNGFSILSMRKTIAFTDSLSFPQRITRTSLHMGLFDGIKEAFQAPTLERSYLDSERETPIDRWMGWNVKSTDDTKPSISSGTFSWCISLQLYLVFPSSVNKDMH